MAYDRYGRLWATTGGEGLVHIDPANGQILEQYATRITLGLAADPASDLLYVATGSGVKVFDTQTRQFRPFSRTRVDALAHGCGGDSVGHSLA